MSFIQCFSSFPSCSRNYPTKNLRDTEKQHDDNINTIEQIPKSRKKIFIFLSVTKIVIYIRMELRFGARFSLARSLRLAPQRTPCFDPLGQEFFTYCIRTITKDQSSSIGVKNIYCTNVF